MSRRFGKKVLRYWLFQYFDAKLIKLVNQSDPVSNLRVPKTSNCDVQNFETLTNSRKKKHFHVAASETALSLDISQSHTKNLIYCEIRKQA